MRTLFRSSLGGVKGVRGSRASHTLWINKKVYHVDFKAEKSKSGCAG
jgi:hypothetical protein